MKSKIISSIFVIGLAVAWVVCIFNSRIEIPNPNGWDIFALMSLVTGWWFSVFTVLNLILKWLWKD